MPEFRTHLTFIFDPGHSWLKVPLAEIVAMGNEEEISAYSFIEGQYAYLEEDCDCPRYLEARSSQGHSHPEITDQYVDRFERPYLCFHGPSLDTAFWDNLYR